MKKKHFLYIIIPAVIILIAIIARTGNTQSGPEVSAQKAKVVSVLAFNNQSSGTVLSSTGVVVSEQEADLKSQSSGQVTSVNVRVGDTVSRGQVLATLSNADIKAQLAQAEAAVLIQRAQLAELERKSSGSSYVGTVERQQQTLIENAYSKLLSEGLVAEPASDSYTVRKTGESLSAPTISGRYSGPEGRYKIIIDRGSQFFDYEISVFDLETVRDVDISDTAPTPLGTRGLYISFPDPIDDYKDTRWYVNLPNTKSSSYTQNYNAYVSAKENADTTLQQSSVSQEQIESQKAQVAQAEANVTAVQAQLAKTVIRAPFSGSVVAVPVSVGDYVGIGQSVVSLINDSGIYVQSFMSSDESKMVKIGNSATIDGTTSGTVAKVSSGINTTNGKVEVVIVPDEKSTSLVIGEYVDVEIQTGGKSDSGIVSLPLDAVRPRSDGSVVYAVDSNGVVSEERVETGSIIGDFIEITKGISSDMFIAASARGLSDGMQVEVNK